MELRDETGEDDARPWTRYALMGCTALLVGALLLVRPCAGLQIGRKVAESSKVLTLLRS